MPTSNRSSCPISFALDIFGDKWSLLVMRDILFKDKCHYHEFIDSEEKISTNILADRLTRLELEGLILKKRDPANGKKFIYSPTSKALDLIPMLLEMILWSAKYDSNSGVSPENAVWLNENRGSYIKKIIGNFSD